MPERKRLYISLPADRSQTVMILTRNGYTVREGKEKVGSVNKWYVEYWRESG